MSFEWRTDEDDGWQEPTKRKETAVSPSFLRRRWRFLLVALLGVATVWGVVQWQINQRVTTATVEVESELLNTHNFVLQTAVDQDEDLFKSNLSGRDPAWAEAQKTLLDEGLLLDRPMLGWQHELSPDQLSQEDVTITLDPAFDAAELLYPQTYTVQTPSGEMETVTLQHTAVYRLGERRWLYSPPLDGFWGEWDTWVGKYITLAFPERDAPVAEQLGPDLEALLRQMCTELADLNCGDPLRVNLRLGDDPETLLASNEVETVLKAGLRLELPAPTLLGLPTDEAGYQTLYRAYGVQVATAVLAHQIEYDCCRHELFFRALRDYQLAQLGLQAWPLEEAMYSQMLAAGFDGNVLRHWTRRWEEAPPQFLQVWVIEDPDPIWQQVYMLIEYLNEQETAVSPVEMMRLLRRSGFHSWARDVLSGNYYQNIFPTQFLKHIYVRSIDGQQAEPPIPFPEGEIVVICNDDFSGFNNRVFAYNLTSQVWEEKFTDLNLPLSGYLATYDGKNFILTENSYVDPDTTTNSFYLVTEGEKRLVEEIDLESSSEHFVYYYTSNGPAKYLLRYEFEQERSSTMVRSLDCPMSGCPGLPLAGYPLFSPNEAHIIEHKVPVQNTENSSQNEQQSQFELSVVSFEDGTRRPIGQGGIGFWLDNNTYGFSQMTNDGWELVTSTLSQFQPRVLLREADILAEIPGHDGTLTFLAGNTFALVDKHELILQVFAGDEPGAQSYLFRIQLTDDLSSVVEIDLVWSGSFSGSIGASPDGRYIILVDYNNVNETPHTLLDLETGQLSEPIVSRGYGYGLSWSPDGQWFVQNTDTYVLLHAPAYDYQHYIPHGLGECQQVALSVDE